MDIPVSLGSNLKLDLQIVSGKITLGLEFDGLDAAIDAIKPSLPAWAQALADLVKKEVDSIT